MSPSPSSPRALSPQDLVRRFAARTALAGFVGGSLSALAATAVLLAVALLLVRAFGGHLPPQWWWTCLLLPACVHGALTARAARLPAADAAAHLDQRLQLRGLLLAAIELGPLDAGWQPALQRGLAQHQEALPHLRWRGLWLRPAAALLLLAGVCLLPAPSPAARRLPLAPAVEQQVRQLQQQFAELKQQELPQPVQQELEQKLDELEHKLDQGEVPQWRDLDQLQARLDREQLLQQAQALAAEQAAQQLQAGKAGEALAGLAAKLDQLQQAGVLDKLPASAAAALQGLRGQDGAFDLSGLDAAQLQALADLLGSADGALASALAAMPPGSFDPAALRQLLQQLQQAGQLAQAAPQHEHGPECGGGT